MKISHAYFNKMATNMEVKTEGPLKWFYLPITLDLSNNPKETFIHSIMPHVRPEWSEDAVRVLQVNDGLGCSNQLLGFYQEIEKEEVKEEVKEKKRRIMEEEGSIILVRINGPNSEHFTDRRKEIVAMVTLHQLGQGNPPLYFEFSNGICFGYVPGRPINEQDYKNDVILTSIMSAVAHLHSIRLPDGCHGNSSILPEIFHKLLALIPTSFKDEKFNETFRKTFVSKDSLSKETHEILEILSTFKSPLIYCHNDLQHGNIIYNETSGKCVLIDHEYGGLNYLSCELGDLFSEQAGLDMPDYSKYPNENTQKNIIRVYLSESAKIKDSSLDSITEEAIHSLYVECNKGCLIMDLLWSLWSLVQLEFKGLQTDDGGFDYLEYSKARYGHYIELKQKWINV